MTGRKETLAKIREICLKLPEATEGVSWGHPTFKAGKKAFAVLDEYNRGLCISFKAMPSAKEVLLKDPRFFRAPYADSQGWVCLKTNARLDWKEVKNFILQSYRQVALKRMLSKLEDPG